MRFWLDYILTAVVGTLAVYYGAPQLQSSVSSRDISRTPAVVVENIPAEPAMPPPSASRPVPPAGNPTVPVVPVAPVAPVAPATPTAVLPSTPSAPPPSSSLPWGMTVTRTACYSPEGANLGMLAGGATVESQGRRTSSAGEMVVCRLQRGAEWAGPYLIAAADLVLFQMPRQDVPAENLQLLKEYYEYKGRLDARLAELKKPRGDSGNPYAAEYRRTADEYNAFVERSQRLTAQRDRATGAERARLIDQLRGMIGEGQRLKAAFDQAQDKHRKWQSGNADPTAPDPSADEQVLELQRRIALLDPKVRAFLQ